MTPAEARAQLEAHRATCGKALFRCADCLRAEAALALLIIDDLVQPHDAAWSERAATWWERLQSR